MSKNFESRLNRLRSRRSAVTTAASGSAAHDAAIRQISEAYDRRGVKTASTYALGAMEQVNPDYTKRSYLEGERVRNQLETRLGGIIPIEFDYQGSVPLNIHIKGVSDIDLLLLRGVFVSVDQSGVSANTSLYSDWNGPPAETLLGELRRKAEGALVAAFPEASVDISGSKAITISGGSLQREVDLIPAHWYDTADYQRSLERKDRGVYIYLKNDNARVRNYPFLHMHKIEEHDALTGGNAKKVIRLIKTLVADYEGPVELSLSSYDIASLVWHFDIAEMRVSPWNELGLLTVAKLNLDRMIANELETKELDTPDRTRKIIDKSAKFEGLVLLRGELRDLIMEVTSELRGFNALHENEALQYLRNSVVPVV